MTHDHFHKLRELAKSIPNSNATWERICAVCKSYYPNLPLSTNALRCRLKEKKVALKVAASTPTQSIKPQKRSRETSCSSCRQRKKRCGDLTVNPHCTRPQSGSRAQHVSLDHFLLDK
ncbi:hypothetical protein F442_14322 [Phytophthora nicotianae P10297]|uniref:Uncharacterized protein n=3 Tax=Phytophthora nicotianae TaxID=4792 RepID=V9END8_PHYNI|nr:hypothetical protein F443_14479 [Phytophthora nicotianae P1569]ETM39992.1 hypothetical protein L914_13935 [Phytophthora nicotianae]ETP37928.1 hypothetical protein F442_14322 [Phytophthora nicotianae P10297]